MIEDKVLWDLAGLGVMIAMIVGFFYLVFAFV